MARLESRASQKIRKGDMVRVITGREAQAGKTGKVLKILTRQNRVVVEKVNMVKRHQRPNQQHRQGGIIEKEAPLHLSNVLLVSTPKESEKKKKKTSGTKKDKRK